MVDTSIHAGGSVSYVSADPIPKIAVFYDAALASAGKKPGPTADNAEAAVRFVGKDAQDGGGTITLSREKSLTSVTILFAR